MVGENSKVLATLEFDVRKSKERHSERQHVVTTPMCHVPAHDAGIKHFLWQV